MNPEPLTLTLQLGLTTNGDLCGDCPALSAELTKTINPNVKKEPVLKISQRCDLFNRYLDGRPVNFPATMFAAIRCQVCINGEVSGKKFEMVEENERE